MLDPSAPRPLLHAWLGEEHPYAKKRLIVTVGTADVVKKHLRKTSRLGSPEHSALWRPMMNLDPLGPARPWAFPSVVALGGRYPLLLLLHKVQRDPIV